MDSVYQSAFSQTPPQPPVNPVFGYPRGGNPQEALRATVPGDWWYHMMTMELRNLIQGAGINPDAADTSQLLQAVQALIASAQITVPGVIYVASGQALPESDIGPIIHRDYGGDIMFWHDFTENGANYRGYACWNVGAFHLDTQPTPRSGWIPTGSTNLSETAYAALLHWAMHHGLEVAPGEWNAGEVKVKRNGNGTFDVYDLRGEFVRGWDGGRGVDAGRVFGTWQGDEIISHAHSGPGAYVSNTSSGRILCDDSGGGSGSFVARTGFFGSSETRSRNVALFGAVKF